MPPATVAAAPPADFTTKPRSSLAVPVRRRGEPFLAPFVTLRSNRLSAVPRHDPELPGAGPPFNNPKEIAVM